MYNNMLKYIKNKKAPGKGGHHLAPFCPLTHPELLKWSVVDLLYGEMRAWLNLAESQPLLYSHLQSNSLNGIQFHRRPVLKGLVSMQSCRGNKS